MGCVDIVVVDRRQTYGQVGGFCCGPFGSRFGEGT